ncbi:MAG: aspartate kinase [Proteobacteria bacterium]|nr:aspartate kinase [Pseudomonadota bacterium]NCA28605.1 aspartate kinase [Pseudomonadota bacterium]
MMLIVQKFGGTSVGDISRIKNVSRKVKAELDKKNKVIVVVSAMSGVTNQLVDYCHQVSTLTSNDSLIEYDSIVATGEQVTSGLLALELQSIGYKARSFLGWQIPIKTDYVHSKARIDEIDGDFLLKSLQDYDVIVIAGFQGINLSKNRITTLGRGGSDTSAVAIAASVKADLCDIYTDVDGVYTTDPRITDKARRLNKVTYEEMLEMAYSGSKVLQTRSVAMAMAHNVRVRVLSSFGEVNENSGTILVNNNEEIMERRLITGISYSKSDVRITLMKMPDHPGLSATIFGALANKEVNVDMIVQNISPEGKFIDITFTTSKDELERAKLAIDSIKDEVKYSELKIDDNIAKISIIGVGMISHSGVAHTMFKTLADKGINLLLISTSEIKISVLIAKEYGELAVRVLHDAFGLEK